MSDPQTIRTVYGSCTWPHGSTRVNTYVIATEGYDKGRRLFPKQTLSPVGRASYQEAARDEDHGTWTFTNFEHKEGALVLVQVQTSKAGRSWAQGAMVLRLRADAPLRQINANTIVASGNLHKSLAAFVGRGDILTPREANLLGAGLSIEFIEKNMIDRSHLEACFAPRILAEEITAKPKVKKQKVGGRARTVIEPPRKKRKIKLR